MSVVCVMVEKKKGERGVIDKKIQSKKFETVCKNK
jgi:hypothetical protein